ncbi:MAG: serpin family protein [Candidatus Thiodiazotropha sp.]
MTISHMPAERDAEILSYGYNSAGHALFCRLLRDPGNIVFSPFSIGAAMAMALAGARGETEGEIARLFIPKLSGIERENAHAAMLAILNRYNTSASPTADDELVELSSDHTIRVRPYAPPETKLVVANALAMVQPAILSNKYIATLTNRYAAELLSNATVEQVNAWIHERTNWESAFERELTCDEDFHLANGEIVKTPMMHKPGVSLSFATGQGYRAIRIPYVEYKLGMTVVLPDQSQDIVALGEHLDADELSRLRKTMASSPFKSFDLVMPRFKTSARLELQQHLQEMGIKLAFDPIRADFGGIVVEAEIPFWISEILHCAVVDVNEEGTEAAAATIIMMRAGSCYDPSKQEPFIIDRPFLFYITDDVSGAVLFQGKVADPRMS